MTAVRGAAVAGALVVGAGTAAAAGRVELLSPSTNPTEKECAALARHNAEISRRVLDSHQQCLGNSPNSSSTDYKQADPCSKRACRPIHLQMEWVRDQSSAINRDCRARVPKDAQSSTMVLRPGNDAGGGSSEEAKRWVVKTDELLESAKKAIGIVQNRDRPWALAEMAWGEGAAHVRREVADRVSGGATRDNLDWNVYDLIFNKAYDAQLANAQAARNPVARLINEGMLSRLYVMQAQGFGQLEQAMYDMDKLSRDLPTLSASNRLPPVFYGGLARAPASPPAGSPPAPSGVGDCGIFADTAKSSELVSRDPAAWMTLNNRCNGGR